MDRFERVAVAVTLSALVLLGVVLLRYQPRWLASVFAPMVLSGMVE
jgi:hypothetical protein